MPGIGTRSDGSSVIPASGTVTASAAETGPPTLNSSRLPSVLTPVSFRLPVRARPSSVFADSGEIT